MILRVTHTTTYRYSAPVSRTVNEAHLRPRDTDRQHCQDHAIVIEPAPSSRSERRDRFGNQVTSFAVDGPLDELVVTATSEVSVAARPPLPSGGPTWEQVRDTLAEGSTPDVLAARQFCADSPAAAASPAVRAYAAPSFRAGRTMVDTVADLTDRIFDDFAYEPGATTVATPVDDVLVMRRGVCQDFAHLAVGCFRSVGLAARYVSGYLESLPPAGEDLSAGTDASHAWAAVFLPGWGWLDIDPTNDRIVGMSYVTTAWGREYSDVPPLAGVVYGGGDTHSLAVAVDVVRVGDAVRR